MHPKCAYGIVNTGDTCQVAPKFDLGPALMAQACLFRNIAFLQKSGFPGVCSTIDFSSYMYISFHSLVILSLFKVSPTV